MIPPALQGIDLLFLAEQDPDRTGLAWMGFIPPEAVLGAAERLLAEGYHLEDVSGLDATEGLLAVYTFDHMQRQGRISLRAILPHERPEIPSIGHIYQGALWHEREAHDFYGILFTGHPGLIPLLLPADMQLRPLLKEESGRTGLRILLGGERLGRVVHKAQGFDLLDGPGAVETGKERAHA